MDFSSNEERILGCRSYLVDACLEIAEDIRTFTVPRKDTELELVGKLKISDDVIQQFTADMV
jgi:hypothetical protein